MQAQVPIGSICVIRDDRLLNWTVALCQGTRYRQNVLARFASQGEAMEFARAEQTRRNQEDKTQACVLNVDDCPCQFRGRL